MFTAQTSPPPQPPPPPSPLPLTTTSVKKPIVIRSVWSDNLESEFELLRTNIERFPFVSMDTEFPGVVLRPAEGNSYIWDPAANYSTLKMNVDIMNLIQVGLTLSDADGNLPDLGTDNCYIWEFNFSDFNMDRDVFASDSIDLLKQQGVDFERNLEIGIQSIKFAELLMSSGIVCNEFVSWVVFHCSYDFGYLIKILTQKPLPQELDDFRNLIKVFFGTRIYDLKQMAKSCQNLYGGLDRVAQTLGVEREAGKGHQAGSDSLLTWRAFQKIREVHFRRDDDLEKCAGLLFGLEVFCLI